MNPDIRLDAFRSQYAGMDKDAFLARFPSPFLLINTTGLDVRREKADKAGGGRKSTILQDPENAESTVFTLIYPVETSERSGAGSAVTVGRAAENDIIVPNPCVSRRHAVFQGDAAGEAFTITDVGSSYGTALEGRRLPSGKAVPIQPGDTIVFGQAAHCTFLSAEDLFRFLQTMEQVEEDT